jgi:hypothetical protein
MGKRVKRVKQNNRKPLAPEGGTMPGTSNLLILGLTPLRGMGGFFRKSMISPVFFLPFAMENFLLAPEAVALFLTEPVYVVAESDFEEKFAGPEPVLLLEKEVLLLLPADLPQAEQQQLDKILGFLQLTGFDILHPEQAQVFDFSAPHRTRKCVSFGVEAADLPVEKYKIVQKAYVSYLPADSLADLISSSELKKKLLSALRTLFEK